MISPVDVDLMIQHAINHSRAKNGPFPTDPVRGAALLVNEASEALAEALKLTNPGGTASHRGAKGTAEALAHEAAQAAACAIQLIRTLL